jgi:Ca-activated chloride channel family protein
MDLRIGNLPAVHLLWSVPLIGLVVLYGFHRRRRALELFARTELLSHLTASVDRGRQWWRAGLTLAGLGLVAFSIARPQWGSEVQQVSRKGIDLVVLLDLSKSMLAEDVTPSRLARAKLDLKEMLQALGGDRVGLIAFAGHAEIRCPLTFDYGFFEHVLDEMQVGAVALGGTNIAAAIHRGLECFQDEFPNHKAMLLITDGEDHEAFVKEAAQRARARNVKIFSVGIGDAKEGRQIPISDERGQRRFLASSSGEIVYSKLNPMVLQEVAMVTEGKYIPVGVGTVNLMEIYRDHIATLDKKELEGFKEERYKDRFQWFLGLGLGLLMLEPLIATRRARERSGRPSSGATKGAVDDAGCRP